MVRRHICILAALLTVVTIIGLTAGLLMPALAESDEETNITIENDSNYYYAVDAENHQAAILLYIGKSGYVTVPSTYNGNTIVGIGAQAFSQTGIKELTIPSSIEAIGDEAFSGCSSLVYIKFSRGLRALGNSAFSGCSSKIRAYIGYSLFLAVFITAICPRCRPSKVPRANDIEFLLSDIDQQPPDA